jgi:HSP20 family protein
MLMRFDPFHEWETFSEQFRGGQRAALMAVDAYRAGELLHVDLDLPGVKPESIEVTVEKNVLTVKAERTAKTDGLETIVCERPVGTFTRNFFLRESLDTKNISASYENGVLLLTIPVADQAKTRHIQVNAATQKETIGAKNVA